MILYFTGTGNSRYVANVLKGILDDECQDINTYLKEKKTGRFSSDKAYVFVTPSYMSRMPMAVEKFLGEAEFSGNKNAYFIFTSAEAIGNAHKPCQNICVKKGLTYKGTSAVPMPANYVVMYDVKPRKEAKELAERALHDINKIAENITNGLVINTPKEFLGHKSFTVIAPAFTKIMVSDKSFIVNDNCIACGQCEIVCPKGNIIIKDKKPVWNHDCMHCMACISVCPVIAINYGKKTENRNRYYLEK